MISSRYDIMRPSLGKPYLRLNIFEMKMPENIKRMAGMRGQWQVCWCAERKVNGGPGGIIHQAFTNEQYDHLHANDAIFRYHKRKKYKHIAAHVRTYIYFEGGRSGLGN